MIKEDGCWSVGLDRQDERGVQVFIKSDDLTHDVELYINGNFKNMANRLIYAEEIAKRLNAYK